MNDQAQLGYLVYVLQGGHHKVFSQCCTSVEKYKTRLENKATAADGHYVLFTQSGT